VLREGSLPEALSREAVREVDRRAVEVWGIPGIVLMENAALGACGVARRMLGGTAQGRRVAVVAGGGNNGGDGYAMARHLHIGGAAVTLLAGRGTERLKGDAAVNARIVEKMGLPVSRIGEGATVAEVAGRLEGAELVVDAMLGTGFEGEVRGRWVPAIEAVNRQPAPVLAVDVPSGFDLGRGAAGGAAVRATCTVTFVAPKLGFETPGASAWLGTIEVAGIGVPPELVAEVRAAFAEETS